MDDREKLITNPPPAYGYSGPPEVPPPPYYPPPTQQHQQRTTIVVEQGRPIACATATVFAPPDYTYLAIIAVICCFPLGLVALHMANKVKQSVADGDIRKAYNEAIAARLLSRLSISLGTVILTLIILAIVLPITLSGNSYYNN